MKTIRVFILLLLICRVAPAQIDRITGKNFATRSEVLARHGMVCTSVPAATQVGIDILKRGGSAVDAAIAANATLGLMEPVSNGVGGDLFAIVYSAKENKLYGINGSGRSPLGLSYEQMKAELDKLNRKTIPPARDAADQRAGNGRCLGGAAQKIRQTEIERRSRAGDSLRRRRFSRDRADRVLLALRAGTLQRTSRRLSRNLHARRQRPDAGERRHFQKSGAGENAAIDRRERARRFLQRRDRGQDRQVHAGRTAVFCAKPISKSIHPRGSIRFRRTIAATTFSNCRRTARGSRRCKS